MDNQRNAWIAGIVVVVIIIIGIIIWRANSGPNDGTNATTTPGQTTVLPYGQVTLSMDQTGSFPGISITPIAVAEDSRCAAGVQCIQAGTVRVLVRSTLDTEIAPRQDTVRLASTTPIGDFSVSLVTVTPAKDITKTIKDSDYRFTFEVHESAATSTLQGKG